MPRDGCETLIDRLPLLAHAGAQDDDVINARRSSCSKRSRWSLRSVSINGERPLRTESTTSSQIRRVRVWSSTNSCTASEIRRACPDQTSFGWNDVG